MKILDLLAWFFVLVVIVPFVLIGVVCAIFTFVMEPLQVLLAVGACILLVGCLWGLHRLFGEKHERTF
ncbi:MAG: hypothetical protein M0R80_07725 [Proteobacteria bacterium]|jgi:hypothetical protein|nr:hypothetical protein [Pseudomonadota bacterium]